MEAFKIDRRCFTFTWKIKNFSFCWNGNDERLYSPTFNVYTKYTSSTKYITSWRLVISRFPVANYIVCYLWNIYDLPRFFSLDYELLFLTHGESTPYSVKLFDATTFKGGIYSLPLMIPCDKIFGGDGVSLLHDDTLIIRCKIWGGPNLETERCFAETEIEVQQNSSVWTIGRFSSLKQGEKITQTISRTPTTKQYFIFNMVLEDRVSMNIEINPVDNKTIKLFKCQMFLMDVAGEKIKCGKYELLSNSVRTKPPWVFELSFNKRSLLENESRYLPNDALTFQYEMEFSTGREAGKILKLVTTDHFARERHTESLHERDTESFHERDTESFHERDAKSIHERDTQSFHESDTESFHERDTESFHGKDTESSLFFLA
ncbi:hypothetical protein AVEN_117480-1 [Araneus ventricosus]|uniref:MATH domain-containing protein n=1 Tax=Araneus ventricosus TaxID=182803 RepID=A0A4Y2HVC4_ARAVE|nr:hypothetical protein AVEN_117480-1 [Araneus ventricosus]